MAGEGTGGTSDNQGVNIDNTAPKPAVVNQETHTASPEPEQQSQESRLDAIRKMFGASPELKPSDGPSSEGNPLVEKPPSHDADEYKKLDDNTSVKREVKNNPNGEQTTKITYRKEGNFIEYTESLRKSDGRISVKMGQDGNHTDFTESTFDSQGNLKKISISTQELKELADDKAKADPTTFGWRESRTAAIEEIVIGGKDDWAQVIIEGEDIWGADDRVAPLGQPFFPLPGAPYQLLVVNENGNIGITRLNTKNGSSVVTRLPKSISYENAKKALSSTDPNVWPTAIREAIPASISINKPVTQ